MHGATLVRFAAASALALAASLVLLRPGASAQPRVTFIFPQQGEVLTEPPEVIRLCFAKPVNIRDPGAGGDFQFSFLEPDGRRLGLRISFRPDGMGVDVFPGLPEEPPQGEWTFQWRVTDAITLEPAMGVLRFTVSDGGSPPPAEPPGRCPGPGAPTTSPTPSPTAAATPTGDGTPVPPSPNGDGGGPDILLVSLLTTASIVGAAFIGLILYLARLRIGHWLHAPTEEEGEADGEH